MQTENTGWRRPARYIQPPLEAPDAGAKDLFKAAKLAAKALNLRPGACFVLDQLVGCYGGEKIGGRYLVWPANEFLMERTRLSERGVRYSIRTLIDDGVITTKESANGKRFAIRSKTGQIHDAYGLDLTPLLARLEEFERRCEEIQAAAEHRRRQFDEITICRRSTLEMLNTDWFAETPVDDLQSEFDRLMTLTPRRDSFASPDAALAAWRALHEVTQARYDTACGGNSSRLIEDNKDAPDQSCNNGMDENGVARVEVTLVDVLAACPDAVAYATDVRTERDLIRAAGTLRGAFGTHESAWHEAIDMLGASRAAVAFFVVLQRHAEDNGEKIKNFGGYFRAYVRMIEQGRVDLGDEVRGMRRRRAH